MAGDGFEQVTDAQREQWAAAHAALSSQAAPLPGQVHSIRLPAGQQQPEPSAEASAAAEAPAEPAVKRRRIVSKRAAASTAQAATAPAALEPEPAQPAKSQ